jgi:GntR family transcriptional regulator
MFINMGARGLLLQGERRRFLVEEWPRIGALIQRLGLTPDELIEAMKAAESKPENPGGSAKSSKEASSGSGSNDRKEER